jgi:hypothetical protein
MVQGSTVLSAKNTGGPIGQAIGLASHSWPRRPWGAVATVASRIREAQLPANTRQRYDINDVPRVMYKYVKRTN